MNITESKEHKMTTSQPPLKPEPALAGSPKTTFTSSPLRDYIPGMRRLGNSSLLSIKEALYLGAASPHCFANALYDKVFGLKDLDFPRRIILHLANRCNFACPMCSIGVARADRQKDYVGDTPFEIVQKAIEEAGQHGTYVELLGGEPTLYSKLGPTIELLTKNRLLSYIVTNGFTLKKRAAEMVEAGLKVVLISLDGWDEESSYKRGEVPGSFDAIRNGIAELQRLRGRKMFPIIRIGSVITKVNYHSLDKIADAVYAMGVRRWGIQNYFFMTDAAMAEHHRFKHEHGVGDQVMAHHIPGVDSYLNREEVAGLKESLARVRKKLDGPMRDLRVEFDWNLDLDKYYSAQPPSRSSYCAMPYNRVDVFPDGRIAICGDGHTLGNIKDGTIRSAWGGGALRDFRKVLKQHGAMPMCFRCCGFMGGLKFDEAYAPKSDLVTISGAPAVQMR